MKFPNKAENREDRMVCYCMKVTHNQLISAILGGADDLESLGRACRAGSGCGTCRVDLLHLLAKHGKTKSDG